jgi:beta-glucosidase
MTSFNDNDGVPSSANDFILRDVLRNEWGYKGMVVSDWSSVTEMIAHGFCTDRKDAAEKAANAGVDMEMVSRSFIDNLEQLVKEGKVKEETIDNAVRNILRLKFRLGLFDGREMQGDKSVQYCAEHLAKAKETATQSVVLLKNNGILPLADGIKTIAVTGPMADAPHDQLGTWAFDGEKSRTITPLAALRQEYGSDINILYTPGIAYSRDRRTEGIAEAVDNALKADVVLAFVGEEAILSGEAHSLADLNLKGAQKQLIAALAKTDAAMTIAEEVYRITER